MTHVMTNDTTPDALARKILEGLGHIPDDNETSALVMALAIDAASRLASDPEASSHEFAAALRRAMPDDPHAQIASLVATDTLLALTAGRKVRSATRFPPTPPSRRLPWPAGPDGEPDPDKAAPRIAAALAKAAPEDRAAFWASVRQHVANPTDDVHRRRMWRDAHALVTRAGG